MRSRITDRPAAVYRLYDHAGVLLYVGASVNPDTRKYAHARKSWGKEIDKSRTDITWYPSTLLAARAERDGIRNEHPRYNSAGVRGRSYGGYQGWCKRDPRVYIPDHWALESLRELGARRRRGVLVGPSEVQAAAKWALGVGIQEDEIRRALWLVVLPRSATRP